MAGQSVDFDALAKKHGASVDVDLDALAAKHGGNTAATEGTDPTGAILQKLMQEQGGSGGAEPWSVLGTLGLMKDQAASALGTAGSDIMGMPASIAGLIRHPIDTLKAGISTPSQPQIPESQLPQDAISRLRRMLGGGPNYHPIGENTPISEVIGHGLSMLPFTAAPEILGAAKNVAPAVGKFSTAAAKAGGPDIAMGAVKVGSGIALDQLGVPGHYGTLMGAREAIPQIGSGIVKGFKAGRAAFRGAPELPGEPPNPPGAPPAAAAVEPQAPPPPPGVDPKAWSQLTPEIQDAIYRGAAAKKPFTPPAPEAATARPEGVTLKSPLPETEQQRLLDIAHAHRTTKNVAVAQYFRDQGITPDQIAKMPDAEYDAHIRQVKSPITGNPYQPSTGKYYSRQKVDARQQVIDLVRGGAPSPLNAKPIPPK